METPSDRVRQLFDQAVELSPTESSEFLDRTCSREPDVRREVDSLLNAHRQAAEFLGDPTIDARQFATADALKAGERIGAFTLLRVLGEGGYGIVYLAQEDPPLNRCVALKVIRAGMDTRQVVARFELERQALALLDHPNISKVLSAGETASGRPYFVMELVQGEPITVFCRKHRLDLDARLRLFRQVCSAVEHAHRRGILHRDIKPNNVLVTIRDRKPVPKVIDFGIAKALHSDRASDLKTAITIEPQFLGTPQYMSPEQADPGNTHIDSRSDVYSLGALLYELLTDAPPFRSEVFSKAAYGEIERILREVEPERPSAHEREDSDAQQWTAKVRGDLDWIALKALAKEPGRRYDSAQQLADDVGRYLRQEPISAKSPGTFDRLPKLVARYRFALGILLLAIVCLLSGWGLSRLVRRGRAEGNVVVRSEPAASLPVAPPAGFERGLRAEFFQGNQFQHPVIERIDADVDFLWHSNISPAPGVHPPEYAVRWSGMILVPPDGLEAIGVRADDGARLMLDDEQAVDFHSPARKFLRTFISPGMHRIRLDYWNKTSIGEVHLVWELPAKKENLVPAEALFHPSQATSFPAKRGS